MSRKVVNERVCSLCGGTFKCSFEENDEMGKAFAEAWEICPKCWKGESEFWKEVEGGDENETEKGAERGNEAENC